MCGDRLGGVEDADEGIVVGGEEDDGGEMWHPASPFCHINPAWETGLNHWATSGASMFE